jgi:uncharacterized protein
MNPQIASYVAYRIRQLQDPRILKLELILTDACNLACSYCFEYGANSGRRMSPEVAKGAVDFLVDASRTAKWIGITFIGGEPMLRFELIRMVVRYAKKQTAAAGKEAWFDMTTNGLPLKEDHVRYFRDVGLRYCLSLDGTPDDNDRHRKTRAGNGTHGKLAGKMPLLKHFQHWQGARVTVMPDTAGSLARNIAHLHGELAINQFIIGFATHVPWSDSQIAEYAGGLMEAFEFLVVERVHKGSRRLRIGLLEVEQLDEAYLERGGCGWGCGAGSGRLAVAPDGTFHGCTKLAFAGTGRSRSALPLGSVQTGLSRPDNRRKLLDHSAESRPKCRSCPLAPRCHGGCYAANLSDTGDIFVPADYYCKLVYAQIQAADYARKRLRELGLNNLFCQTQTPTSEKLQQTGQDAEVVDV